MAIKQQNTTPFDSDAQRFILATGIRLMREKRAINYLVQGLKARGLWAKMVAVYPFVGSAAYSCKFNLMNPRDSVLAFALTLVSSPTITDRGVDWNGTNQYANTNINAATIPIYSLNDAHISYYSREDTASVANMIGAVTSDGTLKYINMTKGNYGLNLASPETFTVTNTQCFLIISRTSSTLTTLYRNGVSASTSTLVSTVIPSSKIYLGCRSVNDLAGNFTDKQCAFASIGSGLSTSDSFNFYNVVQQFQIILNRAV